MVNDGPRGLLRSALLVRQGMQLSPDVADERARNVMAQLPRLLASTTCACGAQGTVDGDKCGRCYLEGPPS